MGQPRFTVTGVVLDSPDARELAGFYRRLLGWQTAADEPDSVTLRSPDGGAGLSFQTEDRYVRPVWPAGPGDQQMMVHLVSRSMISRRPPRTRSPRAPPWPISSRNRTSACAWIRPGTRSACGSNRLRADRRVIRPLRPACQGRAAAAQAAR